MNGAHDMGGMMGFGPVAPEADEPLFHAPWERRALAVTLACGALGEWTLDVSRHARETIPPPRYLTSSYYELWIEGLSKLLAMRGMVSAQELAAGRAMAPPGATRRPRLAAADVPAVLAKGAPVERPASREAAFAVGERVRTRVMHPVGHTRLPRYARGKTGIVERVHGVHLYPDASANGVDEGQWLYTIVFEARELWGPEADPSLTVSIDAFEPYLEQM